MAEPVLPDRADEVARWASAIAATGFSSRHGCGDHLPNDCFDAIIDRVGGEQLAGLLVQAVRDGALTVTRAQRVRIGDLHAQQMEQLLRVERSALAVHDLLTSCGIAHVFLKGLALAHSVYRRPEIRQFGDVDLLVDPARFGEATHTLVAAGGVRPLPEVRVGHDARFAKDVPIVFGGSTIDLHRTLIRGPFGLRIPTAQIIERREPFVVSGIALYRPDPADAYLHAALTAGAADDPARLVTLRDLLEIEAAGFDEELVRRRSEDWGIAPAVARGVRQLNERLKPDFRPALADWAATYPRTRRDQWLLGTYLGPGRSYRSTFATVLSLHGLRARLQLLQALALPQGTYRRARDWTWRDHVGRGARMLGGRNR